MENENNEAELLASIMANTEMLNDDEVPSVPQPDQVEDAVEEDYEEIVEDEEVVEEDEVETEDEEVEGEDEVEEDEEIEEEAEAEEGEAELPEEDEIDWDYKVPVTIDGETQHLSLEEIRKGYATQQHLSNQGRELGEARKQIDEYRDARLAEVEAMAEATSAILGGSEQAAAQRYHEIDQQINAAREEGDTYKVQELKDQRELAQQQYWNIRQQREATMEQVAVAKQQAEAEQWNEKVQAFHNGITEVIPEYNEEYAANLRSFGEEVGLSEDFMLSIVDPTVVKVMDDYRKLKQGVSTGAKKRAKAPVKKAPTKKPRTEKQKKASKDNMIKARAFREDATPEDQMDFLRQHAQRTLGGE